MRRRLLSTFVITLLLIISVHPFLLGQDDLYMPLNIKKAYENGTRNYDGTPDQITGKTHLIIRLKWRLILQKENALWIRNHYLLTITARFSKAG